MSEHTPGPWVTTCCDVTGERPVGDSGIRYWYVDPVGEYRGSVCNVHAAEGIGGITIAERDANARLIAAAPDLLAELQNIANAHPATWDDPSDFQGWAQSRARAAIAKAKGESQ